MDPTDGQARVLGYDTASQSEPSKRCIGYMAQRFNLYRLMMTGQTRAVVVIPRDFDRDLSAGRSTAPCRLSSTAPTPTPPVTPFATSARTQRTLARNKCRNSSRTRAWYNPSLRFTVAMIPALVGVVISVPAMAASLALAREREWGTLEGLIATPIRRGELIAGTIIPYVLAVMLSVPLCLATAVYGYRVPFRGNLRIYVILSFVFLYSTMSIALSCSKTPITGSSRACPPMRPFSKTHRLGGLTTGL